ncbi:hypothetical protein GQ85_19845 [Rhodococcus rhodochrous]|nr:hypothetical protein GQ85_19845 [Rhodococcus rhodochrous]
MSANPRLIDTRELAAILGVHRSTILRGRRTHPLYRLGFKLGADTSPLRWHRADVDAYLTNRRNAA